MPPRSQPVSDLYFPCILLQRPSTELIVYSPQVRQVVVIAWPKRSDTPILPENIREWLRRRGLFWCCFCPLESGSSASCQIVHCKDGSVKAYCTDFPPKCGFRMNLTEIYRSALLTSAYPHLPTLESGIEFDIDDVVLAFQTSAQFEPGSYFEGYCGEHVSKNPGIDQKAGLLRWSDAHRYQPYIVDQNTVRARQRATMDLESATLGLHANALRRRYATTSSATTRIAKKKKPIPFLPTEVGPSTAAKASAPIHPEPEELGIIAKLQIGDGLSSYELLGLIEQCGICKLFFTGGVLRRHIFVCPCSEV